MDYLHVGYQSRMKLWLDDDTTIPIVWYRVPAGTPIYEPSTPFRSHQWLYDHRFHRVWSGLGEQWPPATDPCAPAKPYYRGMRPDPGLIAGPPCGQRATWANGGIRGVTPEITLDALGTCPDCRHAFDSRGGTAEGNFDAGPLGTGAEEGVLHAGLNLVDITSPGDTWWVIGFQSSGPTPIASALAGGTLLADLSAGGRTAALYAYHTTASDIETLEFDGIAGSGTFTAVGFESTQQPTVGPVQSGSTGTTHMVLQGSATHPDLYQWGYTFTIGNPDFAQQWPIANAGFGDNGFAAGFVQAGYFLLPLPDVSHFTPTVTGIRVQSHPWTTIPVQWYLTPHDRFGFNNPSGSLSSRGGSAEGGSSTFATAADRRITPDADTRITPDGDTRVVTGI